MTATANLGLPFIEAAQAQKHVTHNEALRILDAAIQIAVEDADRTAPPAAPNDGERHVVAAGATGAWAGQDDAIATFQDGAWAFLAPKRGWCVWSIADDVLVVFDGAAWRDLRDLRVSLDNAEKVGVNTTAAVPNLLSVKSNAALLAAIATADGGSGDVRLQLSKDGAANTASVVFSDAYSGRAEFGLVGADAFKLKVSANGSDWAEALIFDPADGNVVLPRGLALSGVAAPAALTANQDDYAPAGLASAAVLQVSADAARSISGLAGGGEGRVVCVSNVGGEPVLLLDESTGSLAANRFSLGGNLMIAGKQAAVLRYDAAAQRWRPVASPRIRAATRVKSADDSVVPADDGALFELSGSHTLTLAAAATLGDGFEVAIRNVSTGIWTVAASGAGTIDGAGAIRLYGGESCVVRCDGASFCTIGRSSGLINIRRQVVSGVSLMDFIAGISDDFDEYELHVSDYYPIANSELNLQVSEDFGASWKSGPSDYRYTFHYGVVRPDGSAVASAAGSNADQKIRIVYNNEALANGEPASFVVRLQNPSQTSRYKSFDIAGGYRSSDPGLLSFHARGAYLGSLNPINGIRLYASAGAFSAIATLYGLRK